MNTKIIALVAVVVIIVAAFVLYNQLAKTQSNLPTTTSTTETAASISSVMGDQYSSLMQDQLDSLSTGQPVFNAQMQDSIANDMSKFYYS